MVSEFYSRLSADQVISAYALIKLLRRLKAIGTLECATLTQIPEVDVLGDYDVIDMTLNIYGIRKISYDPSRKGQDIELELESLFGRKSQSLRGVP